MAQQIDASKGRLDMKAFHREVRASLGFTQSAAMRGEPAAYAFCALSVLSDAQELLRVGRADAADQAINQAKFLLLQLIEPKEGA